MGPVGFVARHDLGRRCWRLVALALLVGVAGAGVLAAVAGARRTSTSLERFQRTNVSADVEFAVGAATRAQVDRLRRVPGVAAVGQLRAFGLTVPRVPDFFSVGSVEDHEFGVTVDRSRLVAGRLPNPRAPDEVTVGEGFAARAGLHAGDHFTAQSFTVEQIQRTLGGTSDVGAQAGPALRLRAVGIVRRPLDLGDRAASGGLLVLTPAFAQKYQGRIGVFGDRLRVRTDTPADVPVVLRAAKRVFGPRLFLAQSLAIETQGASNAIDVAAIALWIGAAVGAAAACVAIGIVLARDTTIAAVDLAALGELGCTRVQRTLVFGPGALLVAIGGAALGVAGAIALSPFFPFGVARRADPDVGVHADLPVLALGALVIVGFVGVVSLAAAYRVASRRAAGAGATVVARPTFAARLARHGSRPSVTNGVRMALEPGRGRARVPVRSAIAGAVLGIAGITAALLFAASLDRLAADPARYGSAWDFKVIDLTSNTPCGRGGRGLDTVPGVAAVTEVCSQSVQVDGRPTPGLAFRGVKGRAIRPTIVAGRAPALPSEVALGAKTLTVLHKGVGDRVRVSTRSGSGDYRIVGRAVFPSVGPAQPLADGVALTGAGYAPIFDQNIFLRGFVGRYEQGADRTAVARRIGALDRFGELSGPAVPTEIDRLRQVDWLPVALAALLGLMALVAVTHALVVGARRRNRDLALLKALGFTRRDVRATLAWQATTLAAVGLLVGIPAGVFVGQLVWRLVADGLGVTVDPAVPLVGLAVLLVVVVLLVNAVAMAPARRASRLTPAAALRAE